MLYIFVIKLSFSDICYKKIGDNSLMGIILHTLFLYIELYALEACNTTVNRK